MGQQQLLLLVMGVIIVGLALLLSLQLFSENQQKANADALVLRSLRMASDAQRWLQIPAAMGGGRTQATPADFSGSSLDLDILGYKVDAAKKYQDVHGIYFASVSGSDFVVQAQSLLGSGRAQNIVCVRVSGIRVEDVTTEINPPSGNCN